MNVVEMHIRDCIYRGLNELGQQENQAMSDFYSSFSLLWSHKLGAYSIFIVVFLAFLLDSNFVGVATQLIFLEKFYSVFVFYYCSR